LKEDQHDSRKSWLLWIIKSQEEMSSSNVHAKVWRHDHPIPLDRNIMFEERLSYILEDYIYSSVGAYAGEIGLVNVKLV
jgi:putative transposase